MMRPHDETVTVADVYRVFAAREARGVTPTYERLADAVADDPAILGRLGELPAAKRQPNLLFGVVRLLGGPLDPAGFHDFVVANWPSVAAQMRTRATQTNEVGRCAALLPVLAALPGPLALLDVGASAGLNLFPDHYSYRYRPPAAGQHAPEQPGSGRPDQGSDGSDKHDSEVVGEVFGPLVLDCDLTGVDAPTARPTVAWRAGIDLNPLDVTDPTDMAWLEALIWPENTHRQARLRAAVALAENDPPHLVRGNAVDLLPPLAAEAPPDATLVVSHSSVLYQMPPAARDRFVELVRGLPGHWISVEATDVLDFGDLPDPPDDSFWNVLALDGKPLAWVRGHGQAAHYFAPPPAA